MVNNIVYIYIYIYISCYLSIMFHEITHLIFALIFWREFEELSIGADFLKIKFWKIKISLILGDSYLSIDTQTLKDAKTYQIIMFFLSGTIFNIAVVLICFFYSNLFFVRMTLIFNLVLIVFNFLPIGSYDIKDFKKTKKKV